ncbi:MAG TPA: NAD(P)-dependent oxidoreductase [Saprospiraceae bacterium]|nr:NAD(P)-dependent oxidoreductase [Saprospiraceae bacterium]
MTIAITDKVHPLLVQGLEAKGHTVIYDTHIDNESLATLLPTLDGVIINSKIKMSAYMIDLGVKLKFIGRLGSGMEIIDVAYAKTKNIKCINTPDGNCDAVAEHAIGMLLCLANNIIIANQQTKNFQWYREANRGFEIMGKTIGIIGVGHTGSALANKLKGFDMNILGYDKYKNLEDIDLPHVEMTTLEDIQNRADIISFHLPLSNETKYFANENFFNDCKKGVIIINTSRGNVIETEALVNALVVGHVKGACLDVFENEKVNTFSKYERKIYDQLAQNSNIIMTPHIAGWTYESLERIATLMLDRIQKSIS